MSGDAITGLELPSAGLAVAAALGVAAWFVLYLTLVWATRPRHVRPGVRSLELPGSEPPAVVSLLAHGWQLNETAVAATLVDLAARRIVTIEEATPELCLVRLRPQHEATDLLPHERRVLDHVESKAIDGTVPCDALSTGDELVSQAWWRGFSRSVVREARIQGLSRARFSGWPLRALACGALALAVLVGVAASANMPDSDDAFPVAAGSTFVVCAFFAYLVDGERDTDNGLAVAERWMGYASLLREDENLASSSPAAVAIWERHLAYAAATNAAPAATRALTFGAEARHVAWSAYAGQWRQVHISYPHRPGWGHTPAGSAFNGLFLTIAAPIAAYGVWSTADDLRPRPGLGPGAGTDLPDIAVTGPTLIACALLAVVALYGGVKLVLAVSDLFSTRVVQGEVIRVLERAGRNQNGDRTIAGWYVAVDPGDADRVRAWFLPGSSPTPPVCLRTVVTARVTPRLGHVRAMHPRGTGSRIAIP